MAWPTTLPNLNNLDQTTDEPSDARADLLELAQLVSAMIVSKDGANGVAGLDGSSNIPLSTIPVVDVTRGGGGGTTPSQNRSGWGITSTATKTYGGAGGVARLNDDGELRELGKGAAAAPNSYVQFANGNWAAPYPTSAGWITQALLKTASGSVSGGLGSVIDTIVLPGGQYGFYPQVRNDSGGGVTAIYISGTLNESYRTVVGIDPGFGKGEVRQRYVQSSPPYDLGDGEIPLFVFFAYCDGELMGSYEAPEPPWALNGPTDIHTGVQLPSLDKLSDAVFRERWLELAIQDKLEPVSDDEQTMKNYDMPEIPTPFEPRYKTIMVDPVGDEMVRLAEWHRRGYSIHEFVKRGMMKVDNTALNRCGPPGVDVVRVKWADVGGLP